MLNGTGRTWGKHHQISAVKVIFIVGIDQSGCSVYDEKKPLSNLMPVQSLECASKS